MTAGINWWFLIIFLLQLNYDFIVSYLFAVFTHRQSDMKSLALVILVCTLALFLVNGEQDVLSRTIDEFVVPQYGVKVEQAGMVTITDKNIILSTLIKLPTLTSLLNNTQQETITINKCALNSGSTETQGPTFQQNIRKLRTNIETQIIDYLTDKKQLLQPYIIHKNTKQKRSLLAALGGGLLSLVMGGITEYQMYQINKQVRENRETIQQIITQPNNEKKQILILKNSIVGITKTLTQELTYFFIEQNCVTFYNSYAQRLQHNLNSRTRMIDELLWSPLSGSNELYLTPRMINAKTLQTIVQQHSELNQTIFNAHPYLLYSIAKMSLINIDDNFTTAHFALYIPWIVPQNNMFNLYNTAQVGTFINGNTCHYLQLPKHIVQVNNEFYDINLQNCRKHGNFHICSTESRSDKPSCLQREELLCNLKRSQCDKYYDFKLSLQGVLLRNNKDYNTLTQNNSGWTNIIFFNNSRTAYISWHDTDAIQLGNTKIISPTVKFPPIIPSTSTKFNYPLEYIDSNEISNTFTNICNRFNSTLEQTLTLLINNLNGSPKNNSQITLYVIVTIVITIIIFGILLVSGYFYFRISMAHGLHARYTAQSASEVEFLNPYKSNYQSHHHTDTHRYRSNFV